MASIAELYTRRMHEECKYLACWLPSTRMALGDVGLLSQHMFKKLTTLTELGIPFTRDPDSPAADLSTSTTDYTVVSSTARVGSADAEPANYVSITFSRSGATLIALAVDKATHDDRARPGRVSLRAIAGTRRS